MITRLIIAGVLFVASLFASQTQRGKTTLRGKVNHTPTEVTCTYYVDQTTGDDGDNGTTEVLAWKTVAKVNASTFTAGQVVCFKRGETWDEALLPGQSGSAGSPITFTSYGTGALPKITGGAEIYALGITTAYINASYLELRNTNAMGCGVIHRGSHSVLENLTIIDTANDGILIDEGANNLVVRYCTISGSGASHTGDNNSIGIGNTGNAAHDVLVEYCDVSAAYKNNIHVAMTSTGQTPYNITIRRNRIYGSVTQAGVASDAAVNLLVAYNEIFNNATHGILALPYFLDPLTENVDLAAYHNTITGNGWFGVHVDTIGGGTTTVNLRNNIIAENGPSDSYGEIGIAGTTGFTVTSDYNVVYHSAGGNFMMLNWTFGTWAGWLSGTAWDDNSINDNPDFTNAGANDYTLAVGSPAIGSGVYIAGVSTANPPNIGAK